MSAYQDAVSICRAVPATTCAFPNYCSKSGCMNLPKRGERISVDDAHRMFGDLAQIRNGVTTWLEVERPGGKWKPVFESQFHLAGWEWEPTDAL